MTKKEEKKLKTEVLDLLNQAAVLLQDLEPDALNEERWNEDTDEEEPNPEYFEGARFLLTVKAICEDLAKNKEHGEVMEYYSSYCW